MASPRRRHAAVNGSYQDIEKKRYQGSMYYNHNGRSIDPATKDVNPMYDVKNGATVQHRSSTDIRPLQSVQVVIPSPHRATSTMSATATSRNMDTASVTAVPPLDYQLLLLSLAEDYFAAAYSVDSIRSLLRRQSGIWEYQQLIATGLSCLEASIKVWRCSGNSNVELITNERKALEAAATTRSSSSIPICGYPP